MKNKFLIGCIPALIIPFIGLEIWHFSKFKQYTIADFYIYTETFNLLAPAISLALLPNLLLFYLFLNKEHYQSVRGVIAATLLWGVAILFLKFVGF